MSCTSLNKSILFRLNSVIHSHGCTKTMRKIALFALLALGSIPAQAGEIINLPCSIGYQNPDSFKSLVDGEHFMFFGGRGGDSLIPKYSKFLKFDKKMEYQAKGWGYPQEYGICRLRLR